MSKRIFAKEQIESLLQNPNVERCSEKSISYRKEFKVLAVKKYAEGMSVSDIFKQSNFDIDVIGHDVPADRISQWLKIFKTKGAKGLSIETRGRGKGGGRPRTNWSSEKEKIKYLEAEVAYLKEENHFLAKLRKKSLN
jgi:transposase